MAAKDAVAEVLEARGKRVIDVGCGDGGLVRHLVELGADAHGVEISDEQLSRARTLDGLSGRFHIGRGEQLPFPSAWADAVIYLNSLHHVPVEKLEAALAETARVLKAGGLLVVIEPLAAGEYFETMRPIEDETEIRAAAYRALQSPPPALAPGGELFYETVMRFRDVEQFLKAIVAPDPARRERMPSVEAELRRRFDASARRTPDGYELISSMRRNHFRKAL
jgi:ubiquinone/menaquinone biosynthesis C-methylase UbiE